MSKHVSAKCHLNNTIHLEILCIKWKNDKIKNVVNIRHIIFEEQSDLGNSMSF